MRILSNDYLSNLPGERVVAHGGPANFARNFSAFITSQKHEWIGIIHRPHAKSKTSIRVQALGMRRQYAIFSCSDEHYRGITRVGKKVDPNHWFEKEIALIRRFIRKVKPDLLFLNGFSVYAWLLLTAAHDEGLPILIQHAGIAKMEFDTYRHLYTAVGRRVLLEMERDIVRFASKQIFLNQYSQRVFSKQVSKPPVNQAICIPLPYERGIIEKVSRRSLSSSTRALHIGCIARWDRIKNHQAILALAQAIQTRKLPWTVTTVTKILPTRVDRAFKDAYAKTIKVVPPMDRSALKRFYQTLDVLILPSHFDVSPTVVMEAALLGKPTLIAPTVGWVSEYQACGLNRWIIDFSDPGRVITRLKQLVHEPVPSTFQHFLKKTHAPDRVFRAYLSVFTSVL